MRYEPPTLAALATDAGFVRGELPTAVAIAIAASGGHPHHDHPTGMAGCGRYVGLWGVDVDAYPEWAPADLYDPQAAARAAYDLTRRYDGFGWSAHWRAGTDRPHHAWAGTALVAHPYRDVEHRPIVSVIHADRLARLHEQAADRIARLNLWPITTR